MSRLNSLISHFRQSGSFPTGHRMTVQTMQENKAPQEFFDAVELDRSSRDSDPLPQSIRTFVLSDGNIGSPKSHLLEGTFSGDESAGELCLKKSFNLNEETAEVYEETHWTPGGSKHLEYSVTGGQNETESLFISQSQGGETTMQELNKQDIDQWLVSKQ